MRNLRPAILFLFLLAASGLAPAAPGQVSAPPGEPPSLDRLLAQAADYCGRLSRASIDFVCLEEVAETIIEKQPFVRPSPHGRPVWQDETVKHTYLYDYQFVVEGGNKTERRRILELDGMKQKPEDTSLDTRTYVYKNVLFGAVDLLAGSRQGFYRYELKGRESQAGQAVAVIDAVPVPGLAAIVNRGTVWIREGDAAVLKILWNVAAAENSAAIRKTAKELKGTPQIQQVTEFGFEKNGVLFPSRFRIEEAYLDKKGKKKVRSVIEAVYRDYKFFTVVVDSPVVKAP